MRRGALLVMGTVTPRQPGTERPETLTAIWNGFEAHHERIRLHSVDSKYYGVSLGAAEDGSFDYLAGMAVGRAEETPAGAPSGVQVKTPIASLMFLKRWLPASVSGIARCLLASP